MRAFLTALAACLCLTGPALAGTPVELRSELVSGDGRITLGDLFDDAGRAAGVPVGVAPQAGASAVLDAGQVQRIAHANGLDWDNPSGFRRLVVKGGGGSAPREASAPVRGEKTVEVLTYSRSLAAGEIVQPEDVIWAKVQGHLAPPDTPRDAEQIIGQAARRPLREGAAVAAHDLTPPRVIAKDDLVQVIYRDGAVELTLQGKALGPAAVGESFQVLNPQSKKIIQAVATGRGTALTGPEAGAVRSSGLASLR